MICLGDILGQQPAIEWLKSAWREQRLPHGLIFAGPEGVGKGSLARALAALFLCENPNDAEPCGKCTSCVATAAGIHPDLHVVYRQLVRLEKEKSVAKEFSIDVVRQFLLAPAGLRSTMSRGKAFIVEEADLMNPEAQNALLKTLEEPAARTLIVLITDQPQALLPTIRSRSQVLRFAPLEEKLVRDALRKRGTSAADAEHASQMAQGSLGMAVRWLEDGVIERARALIAQLDSIASGGSSADLAHFLKESADRYAEAQLKRDPLSSKDQATREGIATYLRIAADHFRRGLREIPDADEIEQACSAIDACVKSEEYLQSNVNVPLVLQQFVCAMERSAPSERVRLG